jgi:RNA polymerase sigma-70 factor (ECF subfamily)
MSDANHDEVRAGRPAARDGGRGDQALVQRCIAGDEAAWESFLDRFAPLMYGVIRRTIARARGAGESDAEDAFAVVIEVLLRDGCRVLRSFREPFNLAAWLSVLVRRQCRAFLESRRIPETGVETLDVAGGEGAVVDALAAREDAARRESLGRAVRDLLDALSPRDRLIVKLFYFDRRKYREIARIARMPMGNVGKTLARALGKLRERIEGVGPAPGPDRL